MNAILEEILSDYLDERLSSDERAEVEQRLAREPELQAACDALRAVREVLQQLPPVIPVGDWSDSVLERAQELESATETGEPVRLAQHAPPGQPGARRLGVPSYQRFWPVGVIAGLLLIGLFWLRPSFVGQRLAEKASAPASTAAPPTRSLDPSGSMGMARGLTTDSVESETQAEQAVLRDSTAAPLARAPAPVAAAPDAGKQQEASSVAGLGGARRSVPFDRERLQAGAVSIRVDLSKSLFQVVLANHDLAPQMTDLETANQLRAGRASVSKVPREPAADHDRPEVYVVEATLQQLNAALQELATRGSVKVLDGLAGGKESESAAKVQANAVGLEAPLPAAGRRARSATAPKKSVDRSGDESAEKIRRPAGKTRPRYRILFLLDPRPTGKDENR